MTAVAEGLVRRVKVPVRVAMGVTQGWEYRLIFGQMLGRDITTIPSVFGIVTQAAHDHLMPLTDEEEKALMHRARGWRQTAAVREWYANAGSYREPDLELLETV